MQYYISWTHSDPIYHQYLPDLSVLVSPPNVNQSWTIRHWPLLPARLILDSGAYQYHREKRDPSPAAVLERQLQMLATTPLSAAICHLDIPMLGTRNLAELDRRVGRSLQQARWLIESAQAGALPGHVRPLGIIQGYTAERVYVVAQTLADLGYTAFALGSLAAMTANARPEVLRRVEAALEAVGPDLHILGVSSVTLLADLSRLGVRSADSSAPMREAWCGGVYYSRPFRRYKLASAHFTEWRRTYAFAELLAEPLPCDCPVCREDSSRILEPRGKLFVNLRALHNCYHLLREFAAPGAGSLTPVATMHARHGWAAGYGSPK